MVMYVLNERRFYDALDVSHAVNHIALALEVEAFFAP
jgi:hypothetical protein